MPQTATNATHSPRWSGALERADDGSHRSGTRQGALRGVQFRIVDPMELFDALPAALDSGAQLPTHWSISPALVEFRTLADVATAISQVDSRSDRVIEALLAMPFDDDLVAQVLLAGLRRLLFLCRGSRRELLDDLVVEVAIAIGELRRVRPLNYRRHLAYVLVDRARDRQRASLRRQSSCWPVDAQSFSEVAEEREWTLEDQVLDRLRLRIVREQVAASGDNGLRRSWNSLVELIEAPRGTRPERDRWKYVRRRLGDYLGPDAA